MSESSVLLGPVTHIARFEGFLYPLVPQSNAHNYHGLHAQIYPSVDGRFTAY
jgi:hypothetical protein